MTVINDISVSGYDSASPEDSMKLVLEALHDLVDYELAVVLGFDGSDSLKVHTAAGPLSVPSLRSFSLSLSNRPDIRQFLSQGQPKLFKEEEDHLDTYDEILDLPEGHSCMMAPLMLDSKLLGMLTLDHRSCGVFSKAVVDIIAVISKLIAVALVQSEAARKLRLSNLKLTEERNRLLSLEADAFRNFAGSSTAWNNLKEMIRLVASADSPVLLLGETGTGKEEAARLIHKLSTRSEGPFVALNCSALPEALAESELFGHEKGAFTGAQSLRKGRFELANGGTLFLDELGELPQEIQAKLLRALQEGTFERVGGEKTIKVDVRIIAATHVHLEEAVQQGRFREDLFYRISVFPLRLPPLRERGEDVLILAELFASRLRQKAGWENLSFSPEALELILNRPWPGNVRELRNAIERAAILCKGQTIGRNELLDFSVIGQRTGDKQSAFIKENLLVKQDTFQKEEGDLAKPDSFAAAQKKAIQQALEASGGKIYGSDGAAALLGLKPSTLQSKMKKLGIER